MSGFPSFYLPTCHHYCYCSCYLLNTCYVPDFVLTSKHYLRNSFEHPWQWVLLSPFYRHGEISCLRSHGNNCWARGWAWVPLPGDPRGFCGLPVGTNPPAPTACKPLPVAPLLLSSQLSWKLGIVIPFHGCGSYSLVGTSGELARGTQPINVLKSTIRWPSFSPPFCFVNESVSEWSPSFLPLSHYSLLPLSSSLKKKKTLLFKLRSKTCWR